MKKIIFTSLIAILLMTACAPKKALPGEEIIPLDEFAEGIPWLPMGESNPTWSWFILFNMRSEALKSPKVRQALSYATNREYITQVSNNYGGSNRPATVMTPPEILGRDLYDAVGINYDPDKAKELFSSAGFEDSSDFPEITFMFFGSPTNDGVATQIAALWRKNLGVSVKFKRMMDFEEFFDLSFTDSYDVVLGARPGDYNDPDGYLREPYHSEAEEWNVGKYANPEFDDLVERAAEALDPAERQELYIQAEDILCEEDPGIIPLFFAGDPFE